MAASMKIGLFYGSSTCYTEMAAEKIRDILGEELVDLHNIKDVDPDKMEDYSILILGIPTWDFGEIQEDWEAVWNELPTLKLRGKIVAMYGMGDQLGYSEWFLDADASHSRCLELRIACASPPLRFSRRNVSSTPLLIIQTGCLICHSWPRHNRRLSSSRTISPVRAVIRRWLRMHSKSTSKSNVIHTGQ
jgi:flavodoxin